jgi:hypothetical protein
VSGRVYWANGSLPGADGIDYLPIDPRSKFTFFVVGFEWYLQKSLRIGPNIEVVTYADDAPDGTDIGNDVVPRITFYWTW